MENVFIYNNTFYGLLKLINELKLKEIIPNNIKDDSYNANMFERIIYLKINRNFDMDNFIEIIGKENFNIIFNVFLSNYENKELLIYYYVINAYIYGNTLKYRRCLNCVDKALKISHKVSNENHRFKGFTRFKELKNHIYYAEINPDNNILIKLSNHFKDRLKNEYWIIKDVNHKLYSIYNKEKYLLISEKDFKLLNINLSDTEKNYQDLWKIFYDTIGIKERKNELCRMNFMPKKYWDYIIEVEDEKNS